MRQSLPLCLILLLAFAFNSHSTIYHVPSEYATIQAAMDAASDGDTVQVAAGVYTGPGNRELTLVNKSLTLSGAGPDDTIIDCELSSRALISIQTDGGTLSLKDLGIHMGASVHAAGLWLNGGSAVLSDLALYHCVSDTEGGAVHASDMTLLFIRDVAVDECTAMGDGGAFYIKNVAQFVVDGCEVTDCEAQGRGGGFYIEAVPDLDAEELRITSCRSWVNGGGLYLDDVDGEIRTSLAADNNSTSEGGCVYIPTYCNLTLRTLTLAHNIGSALIIEGSNSIVLEQGLVAFNDGTCSAIKALYHNFDIACSDVYGNESSNYGSYGDQTGVNGNISDDPRFCDAAQGHYGVDNQSPCLPVNNDCGLQMGAYGQECGVYDSLILVPEDYGSIGAAVAAAGQGDTILVSPGTYAGPDNRMIDLDAKSLHIIGRDGSEHSIIDCEFDGRAFFSSPLEDFVLPLSIQGFTIRNGRFLNSEKGGAIKLSVGNILTLRDLVIENSRVFGEGGGLYLADLETGSEISDLVIRDCDGHFRGGGIYLSNADVEFHDALLVGNTAYAGGGLYCHAGGGTEPDEVTRTSRVTLVGNEGGGVYFYAGNTAYPPIFEECIVAYNLIDPGVDIDPEGNFAVDFSCNNVWRNEAGDYGELFGDRTGIDGNISLDPIFCDMDAGDFELSQSSPCLPENNDCGLQMGAFGQGCTGGNAAEEMPATAFALLQNRPNPFNPSTEIGFVLPAPARVDLTVFDAAGRRVATLLADSPRETGHHTLSWRGRNDAGEPLACGVYFYRLETDDFRDVKKMILLK